MYSFECVCVKGTNGSRCETNIDECQNSQCGQNGKCIDGIGGYTCDCFAGYEGKHCENEIDECARYLPPLAPNGTRQFRHTRPYELVRYAEFLLYSTIYPR